MNYSKIVDRLLEEAEKKAEKKEPLTALQPVDAGEVAAALNKGVQYTKQVRKIANQIGKVIDPMIAKSIK